MCCIGKETELVGSSPAPIKRSMEAAKALPIKKRRCIKKSVRFSLLHNKINVRHATAEDLKQAWHQREDYKAMENSARNSALEALLTFHLTKKEPQGFTMRGLEASINAKVREQRQKWIGTTVGGVLLVQGLQRAVGACNPELLREMSLKGSEESRLGAALLGILDSEEAK